MTIIETEDHGARAVFNWEETNGGLLRFATGLENSAKFSFVDLRFDEVIKLAIGIVWATVLINVKRLLRSLITVK